MSFQNRSVLRPEPNHRQEVAVDRIELAVGELASVLLSSCRSHGATTCAIANIRKAVAPVLTEILSAE